MKIRRYRSLAVASAAWCAVTVAVPQASADTTPYCSGQTAGCAIDRYEDPTIDFGDLDSGAISIPPESGGTAVTTASYPYRRNAPTGSGVTFYGLTDIPGGVAGVDISLFESSVNGGRFYLPCKNGGDPYKGACYHPTNPSYYTARTFAGGASSNPFPVGMLVGNTTTNAYCNPCAHGWGRRVYQADLEFYPKNAAARTDLNWVRPRFTSRNEFAAAPGGNGYNMTPSWGTIPGRHVTYANVGRLSGTVWTTTGVADTSNRLVFSVFNASFPAHAVTSTGKPLGSFFAGANGSNGYYTTGAMYAAAYNMRIVDKATGHYCTFTNRTWTSTGLRADFYLDRPHFGRSDYTQCNF